MCYNKVTCNYAETLGASSQFYRQRMIGVTMFSRLGASLTRAHQSGLTRPETVLGTIVKFVIDVAAYAAMTAIFLFIPSFVAVNARQTPLPDIFDVIGGGLLAVAVIFFGLVYYPSWRGAMIRKLNNLKHHPVS